MTNFIYHERYSIALLTRNYSKNSNRFFSTLENFLKYFESRLKLLYFDLSLTIFQWLLAVSDFAWKQKIANCWKREMNSRNRKKTDLMFEKSSEF